MIVAYWIVAGLLALANLGAGGLKLVRTRPQLQAAGLGWVESFSTAAVKTIGALEVAGAVGLILPPLTRVAPWLATVAAICLALLQVGAAITHLRRHEARMLPVNGVLIALSIAAALLSPAVG